MACGWRQHGGGSSIKYIVGMGLAYSVVEMTRVIVNHSIDERRKSNVNHLTIALLAAIGVPHVYMYISMLKVSPIPILLLHLGRYLYTTWHDGKQTKKLQTYLQNRVMMVHYKQKTLNISSELFKAYLKQK
ncbi:hypothetical protein DFA_00255 [Cavenderia fasciculata]|uniref:Transmembrane protein n=1 Tax=Cavenderia fasciculata TaxID=261658 RepID=F4PY17_CACFS|nr:uncharacterized protein DFA_00255 [Cavenderia fasciculata]EGG19677.1 hypothetical protein DFA_00255 [Cavenderia fasciculata]|eukprot:XP_004357971.1 hypothetical protein DFA_00255 [Cavenderia fasciculata]